MPSIGEIDPDRPTAPRLLWPDELVRPDPPSAELQRQRAAFWAKLAPGIFGTRVVYEPTPLELDWD